MEKYVCVALGATPHRVAISLNVGFLREPTCWIRLKDAEARLEVNWKEKLNLDSMKSSVWLVDLRGFQYTDLIKVLFTWLSPIGS